MSPRCFSSRVWPSRSGISSNCPLRRAIEHGSLDAKNIHSAFHLPLLLLLYSSLCPFYLILHLSYYFLTLFLDSLSISPPRLLSLKPLPVVINVPLPGMVLLEADTETCWWTWKHHRYKIALRLRGSFSQPGQVRGVVFLADSGHLQVLVQQWKSCGGLWSR